MNDVRRREARVVLHNAAGTYGHRVLLGVSVLLLTPYLFRGLGLQGFGTWSVMFTLAAMAGLVEWGLTAGVARLIAEARGEGRHGDGRALSREAASALAAPGVLCAAALALVGLLAPGLAAAGYEAAFTTGLAVLAAATLLRLPSAAWAAVLVGYQRWDLFALCRSVETALFAAGAIAAIETRGGPAAVAGAYAGGLVAGALMQGLCARSIDSQLSLVPRWRDRGVRRRALRVSSAVLLADGSRFAGQQFDPVIIAVLRGTASAGPFAAAHKLQSALQSLTLPLVHLLMPMVAELWSSGRRDDVARRLVLVTRVSLQLTLPVAVGLALFATDVVDAWLGSDAPAVTASIVTVLMLAQILSLAAYPAEQVLVGVGRMRALAMLSVAETVLNLSLTAVLVLKIGALGAAFGTLVTTALLTPLRLPLACRAVELRLTVLLRQAIVPALTASAPAIGVMTFVWVFMAPGHERMALGLAAGLLAAGATAAMQLGASGTSAAVAVATGRRQGAVT